MKTKEEIIAVIEKIKSLNIALSVADYEAVLHYLKLSTLNPMKIDEDRFKAIHSRNDIGGWMSALREYNSTLKDHQVLQPLPSEMPLDFKKIDYKEEPIQVWRWIISKYGTPTKKELVSVEEFVYDVNKTYANNDYNLVSLAYHLYNTYSLNPAKREWWMDLKEGDKFMCSNIVHTFKKHCQITKLYFAENYCVDASHCTPYIEPSIHDKFMASLSDEQKKMYEEMKEVKG